MELSLYKNSLGYKEAKLVLVSHCSLLPEIAMASIRLYELRDVLIDFLVLQRRFGIIWNKKPGFLRDWVNVGPKMAHS